MEPSDIVQTLQALASERVQSRLADIKNGECVRAMLLEASCEACVFQLGAEIDADMLEQMTPCSVTLGKDGGAGSFIGFVLDKGTSNQRGVRQIRVSCPLHISEFDCFRAYRYQVTSESKLRVVLLAGERKYSEVWFTDLSHTGVGVALAGDTTFDVAVGDDVTLLVRHGSDSSRLVARLRRQEGRHLGLEFVAPFSPESGQRSHIRVRDLVSIAERESMASSNGKLAA